MRASKRGAKASCFLLPCLVGMVHIKGVSFQFKIWIKGLSSSTKIQDRNGSSYINLRKSPSQVCPPILDFNRCSQVRSKNSHYPPGSWNQAQAPLGRQGPYPASTSEDKGFDLLFPQGTQAAEGLSQGQNRATEWSICLKERGGRLELAPERTCTTQILETETERSKLRVGGAVTEQEA